MISVQCKMSGVTSVGLNFLVKPASRNWQGRSAASHLISLGRQAAPKTPEIWEIELEGNLGNLNFA